jgi:hypothetical protein
LVIPPIRNSATCAGSAGDTDLALVQDVIGYPFPGLGLGQRLGQEFLGLEHLDPALAHRLAELVVLGLGAGHPQHVVEEQFRGVGRGQPGVFQPWPVHHDLA